MTLPDGSKMAMADGQGTDQAFIFDFDNGTGIISNPILLPTSSHLYGVAFSPDNSKLYLSEHLNISQIDQYDLNSGNNKTIINVPLNSSPKGLQLGPDGKIYVVTAGNSGYLGIINYPNLVGISSNYTQNGIYLNGKTCEYACPSFIDNFIYPNQPSDCPTGIFENSQSNDITIYPNPFSTETTLKTDMILVDAVIHIYNSYGQEVNQMKSISGQTASLFRNNLPSGVYFYQLIQQDKVIKVDKLIIVDNLN